MNAPDNTPEKPAKDPVLYQGSVIPGVNSKVPLLWFLLLLIPIVLAIFFSLRAPPVEEPVEEASSAEARAPVERESTGQSYGFQKRAPDPSFHEKATR